MYVLKARDHTNCKYIFTQMYALWMSFMGPHEYFMVTGLGHVVEWPLLSKHLELK